MLVYTYAHTTGARVSCKRIDFSPSESVHQNTVRFFGDKSKTFGARPPDGPPAGYVPVTRQTAPGPRYAYLLRHDGYRGTGRKFRFRFPPRRWERGRRDRFATRARRRAAAAFIRHATTEAGARVAATIAAVRFRAAFLTNAFPCPFSRFARHGKNVDVYPSPRGHRKFSTRYAAKTTLVGRARTDPMAPPPPSSRAQSSTTPSRIARLGPALFYCVFQVSTHRGGSGSLPGRGRSPIFT